MNVPQLMISYRGLTPPDWVLSGIRNGRIAGICLFRYNVESPAGLRETSELLRKAARSGGQPPPLIGIDQEGGQLQAVTGGTTELPGNMALGATGSEELAERAGRLLGREILALGCNLDFAPVVDLAGHPGSPVVGTRAFGDDPELVARLGAATIRGMQSPGVLATAKHFPGHGDTALDSHHALPTVSSTRRQLERAELVPFRAAIAAGVGAVMSAHVRYPRLDDAPATLSKPIMSGLLRSELGFEGLAITDAMDMAAVADAPAEVRARQALDAGCDLVLLGHLSEQARLVEELAARSSHQSLKRIANARAAMSWELPDISLLANREHRQLAQEIAERSITLVPGAPVNPLSLQADETLGLVTVSAGDLTPADSSSGVALSLAPQLARRHPNMKEVTLHYGSDSRELAAILEAVEGCAQIVVATVNAVSDDTQVRLLQSLAARGNKIAHLALRTPADALVAPPGTPTLCSYGIRPANIEAAVKVLFGEIPARGTLPVRLP